MNPIYLFQWDLEVDVAANILLLNFESLSHVLDSSIPERNVHISITV